MPELKIISTITETTVAGINVSIKTSYIKDELPNTILARISEDVNIENGVSFIEGQLLIKIKDITKINYFIDNNGELNLIDAVGDGGQYSINTNGELEYQKIN